LYTILEKNISKAKLNREKNNSNQNKKSLNCVPYLPPLSQELKQNYKYTIVIDIDETLGHFIQNEISMKYFNNYGYIFEDNTNKILFKTNNKNKIKVGMFLIRPYAKYFLEKLNNLFFEIVIFSAGTKEYCDKVLDILDINNNIIKYRLYRSHLSLRNINNDVKDLSLLGRDLSKVIMIDNFSENYKLQQDNGLPINSWFGDANDTSLRDLIPIMNYIVKNNINDVRNVVKKVKMQLNNLKTNNFCYDKINLKI
jgi:CTD small phosphatase-like protein 2